MRGNSTHLDMIMKKPSSNQMLRGNLKWVAGSIEACSPIKLHITVCCRKWNSWNRRNKLECVLRIDDITWLWLRENILIWPLPMTHLNTWRGNVKSSVLWNDQHYHISKQSSVSRNAHRPQKCISLSNHNMACIQTWSEMLYNPSCQHPQTEAEWKSLGRHLLAGNQHQCALAYVSSSSMMVTPGLRS